MTPELNYLVAASVLLTVLWMPYIIGVVQYRGMIVPHDYVELPDTSGEPAWVKRANRAHLNMVEQFGPFAALILVANAAGISTPITAGAAAVFFWARVGHTLIMLTGFSKFMARTLVFSMSMMSVLLLAGEIVHASM